MKKLIYVVMAYALCMIPLTALADWDYEPNNPFDKWIQMPDPNGWDVKVTLPKILADDFLCESPDPITDIHFWGSWKHDDVGEIQNVHLSIHDDLAGAYPSQPLDPAIWEIDLDPSQFTIRHWGDGQQGWLDPNTGQYIENDHYGIYQVNVFLDEADWFRQEGTPDNPRVYWLDIQVTVADPEFTDFGWKTSIEHWRDDAVWRDDFWPQGQYEKLEDPITGQTLDMAFVLTTIPEPGMFALVGFGLLALLRYRRK